MIALLEAYRAGLFQRAAVGRNIVAGITVGIVAMPLAMAFAIASGAKPEQGLYTAIVAGIATSLLGGTRVQISGPTGAFIVVLAGITAQYGIDGLQVATLMAGLILLALGVAKLGNVIKFIPDPVIVGFTSGIAVIIWVGQWKDFFGLQPAASTGPFHEKTWALLNAFGGLDWATAAIGAFALILIVLATALSRYSRILSRIPAPLLAMVAATAACSLLHLDSVATIESAFGQIPRSLPGLHMPSLSIADAIGLIGPAFTIAMLGAIESLLTAVVADGMTGTRHNSNQELIGQGAANVLAPLFGGFAATGAIARTATNIRNGATSPLAGVVHAVFLVLIIVVLAPLAGRIPLAALAAILFYVAWNMADVRHFARLLRLAPRSDKLVLLITFLLTVFADLVVAVNVGVIISALMFMGRMARSVTVEQQTFSPEDTAEIPADVQIPASMLVYRIDGPFFFGAVEKLEVALERIQTHIETVVIRLGRVPFADATGLLTLREVIERLQARKVRVVLCGLHPGLTPSFTQSGVIDLVGPDNIWTSIGAALKRGSHHECRPDLSTERDHCPEYR